MSLAYACAVQFGLSETAAQLALSDFSLPGDRWRRVEKDGVIYISDCYNANPTSMVAALETFVALKTDARRIAVLGDMYELGEDSERFHKEVKIKAESLPFEKIIYVGRNFGGLDIETAKKELSAYVRKGDMVLLKASNSVGLGRILD
jgi:UDP-N-acetylmuramoyl-tripeptide--D-alanyl-D-alanine ligase